MDVPVSWMFVIFGQKEDSIFNHLPSESVVGRSTDDN